MVTTPKSTVSVQLDEGHMDMLNELKREYGTSYSECIRRGIRGIHRRMRRLNGGDTAKPVGRAGR